MAIQENELSNSRERITNPWEWIAQFDIRIYLCFFLEIPMFPSRLSYLTVDWSCHNLFNDFGLPRPGFGHPTLRMRGERSQLIVTPHKFTKTFY